MPDEIESLDPNSVLPSPKATRPVNYSEMKSSAIVKAEKTIDSLLKFYLSENIINEEEYIRAKSDKFKENYASLTFIMESCEKSIVTLMETIDAGDVHPRMFEVLATLQKSLLDSIKSQTMYMISLEESAKAMSRDVDVYKGDIYKKAITSSQRGEAGTVSTRGTKDLMKSIKSVINQNDLDNAEEIE
jgi:hypothetical protein